mgnify:FL=1
MYFDIRETVDRYKELHKILRSETVVISDFFPYVLEERIPEIPVSDIFRKGVFDLFTTVGRLARFKKVYTEPILPTGYCDKELLNYDFNFDFIEYEEELNRYIEALERRGYSVQTRPAEELYSSFMEVQKVCAVSGVVNIDVVPLYPTYEVATVKTSDVYDNIMPGFETYAMNILDNCKFVTLTLHTLLRLHNQLFLSTGYEVDEVAWKYDPVILKFPNLKDRVKVVTNSVLKYVGNIDYTRAYIEELLNGTKKEAVFRDYFRHMSNRYGLNESEAIYALVYFDNIYEDYRENFKNMFKVTNAQLKNRSLYLIPEISKDISGPQIQGLL